MVCLHASFLSSCTCIFYFVKGSFLKTDAFDLMMQEITPSNLLMISAILILYGLLLSSTPLHV